MQAQESILEREPTMTDPSLDEPHWKETAEHSVTTTSSLGQQQQLFERFDDNISSLSKDETTLYWGGNTASSQYNYLDQQNDVFYRRPGFLLSAGLVFVMSVTIFISAVIVFSVPGDALGGVNSGDGAVSMENKLEELRLSDKAASQLKLNLNDKKQHKVKSGCESTVFILRHCDKSGDVTDKEGSDHCNYQGFERSQYYRDLFGDEKGARYPSPSYIYAYGAKRSDHFNFREYETMSPLASKLGLKIDSHYGSSDYDDLAHELFGHLRRGYLCGKLVLVSWKHKDMGVLARALGCGPVNGCPIDYPVAEFDKAWQLKFVFDQPNLHYEDLDSNSGEEQKGPTPLTAIESSSSEPSWTVYGTVVDMKFDPLYYSKTVGDYTRGGSDSGGGWIGENDRFGKYL